MVCENDVPIIGRTTTERKAQDVKMGSGTISRSGATCPCCGAMMTGQDIRLEGQTGKLFAHMTSVVIDGPKGKEYRLPTEDEMQIATKRRRY